MTDFKPKKLFKIPENYFNELEDLLLKNTQYASKVQGFKIPKNYFKTLEEIVLKKTVKSSYSYRSKLILSLTSIAATLALFLMLPNTENTETLIEDQAFNDYIESYYLEDMDGYEILSMLENNETEPNLNNSTEKP